MFFLLSGEGSSDMGVCNNEVDFCEMQYEGNSFVPGPMALLIDILVQEELKYSPIDCYSIGYISKKAITKKAEELRGRKIMLPRVEYEGTLYFKKNAYCFAEICKVKSIEKQQAIIGVFFRDSDGTNSSDRLLWRDKRQSIIDGFLRAEFSTGVAMVPKTKSECWIICAVKDKPYENCEKLEDLSGNDKSPKNAPKKILEEILKKPYDAEILIELVKNNCVDPERINMPSFNIFRSDLINVIKKIR